MSAKAKHIPLRRCINCRSSKPKEQLLRFFKDAGGNWQFDKSQKGQSRGSWICNDSVKCYQTKTLKRYFGTSYLNVLEEIKLNTKIQDISSLVKGE